MTQSTNSGESDDDPQLLDEQIVRTGILEIVLCLFIFCLIFIIMEILATCQGFECL